MIKPGDRLPDVTVRTMADGKPTEVSSLAALGTGRVVLFAVPGAFTPGCSKVHLPGYAAKAGALSEKGVDVIACTSVNDAFVLDAWAQQHGVADTFTMLADPDASFAKAVGLEIDATGLGLGVRSQRYAMVIEDGVVVSVFPEEDGLKILNSSAECVLDSL